MEGMFCGCRGFNQPLGSWNVSKAASMKFMFLWACSFNQDISSWDTSGVKDMCGMFDAAKSFNQPARSVGRLRRHGYEQDVPSGGCVQSAACVVERLKCEGHERYVPLRLALQPAAELVDVSNVENMALMFDGAERLQPAARPLGRFQGQGYGLYVLRSGVVPAAADGVAVCATSLRGIYSSGRRATAIWSRASCASPRSTGTAGNTTFRR